MLAQAAHTLGGTFLHFTVRGGAYVCRTLDDLLHAPFTTRSRGKHYTPPLRIRMNAWSIRNKSVEVLAGRFTVKITLITSA